MTSFELLCFYEKILTHMQALDFFTKTLSDLINEVEKPKDIVLLNIYTKSVNTDSNARNIIDQEKNKIINKLSGFATNFKTLENFQKFIRVKDEINVVLMNTDYSLESESDKILDILDSFAKTIEIIYEFVKSRDNKVIVDLLNEATVSVNKYNELVSCYESIKYFIEKTENNIQQNEEEKILTLQLYDDNIDVSNFLSKLQNFNKAYKLMCHLLNLDLTEHELKIIKIESGSILNKIKGALKAIEALDLLIKKTTELIFNKYTFEGKIMRHKQIFDLLKENAEVCKKYQELGVNLDSNAEEIEKIQYQIIQSIHLMVCNSTKIRIDDYEISLKDSMKQNFLIDSSKLLDYKDNKQEDEIPKTSYGN